jgi:hypothetical protein
VIRRTGRAHAPRWRRLAGGGATGGARRREANLGLGCSNFHRKTLGHREVHSELNGADVGRLKAAGRGGASPATLPRRCEAPRRKQAAPTGPLPCGGTPCELHGDGGAADEVAHGGGAARVRRRRGASSARISRRKGRDGGYGGGLYRPRVGLLHVLARGTGAHGTNTWESPTPARGCARRG